MKYAKKILAGFLAVVLCGSTLATDAFAAVSANTIENSNSVISENEIMEEDNLEPLQAAETATQIVITVPENLTYTGNSISGFSAELQVAGGDLDGQVISDKTITITYLGRNSTVYEESETAPTVVGDYTVKAEFAEGDAVYKPSTATEDFSVIKRKLATPTNLQAVNVVDTEIMLSAEEGVTYTYTTGDNTPVWNSAPAVKSSDGEDVEFTGLQPSTTYKFWAKRIAETNTDNEADSDVLGPYEVTTDSDGLDLIETQVSLSGVSSNYVYTGSAVTGITAVVQDMDGNTIEGLTAYLRFEGAVGTEETEYGPTETPPTDVGTYLVTASYNGDAEYDGAFDVEEEFTISKATPTISFNAASFVDAYVDNTCEIEATVTGVMEENDLEDADYSIDFKDNNGKTLEDAPVTKGNYTIVATFEGNKNYYGASVEADYILNKSLPVIEAEAEYTFAVGDKPDLKAVVKTQNGKAISGAKTTVTYTRQDGTVVTLPSPLTKEYVGIYYAFIYYEGNNNFYYKEEETLVMVTNAPEKAPAAFSATVTDQTVTVANRDENAEYDIIEKSLIPQDGIVWNAHSDTIKGAGTESVSWNELKPNTEYVVFARVPADETPGSETLASKITQAKAVKTAQYAKVIFTSKNGTIIAKTPNMGYVYNEIVEPDTRLNLVAIPNVGYYFTGWKVNHAEDESLTEIKDSYIVKAKSGTVAIEALFAQKATLSITAGKTFTYDDNARIFDDTVVINKGGTDITDQADSNVDIYEGTKVIAGKELMYNGNAGTYTAVVKVEEGADYKAAIKTFTFTVKKAPTTAAKFDTRANVENADSMITLHKEGLSEGQYYAVSTAKTAPKTSAEGVYQEFDNDNLTFQVVAGKNYYVYTYTKAKDENYLDSSIVRSDEFITAADAEKIIVEAPATEVRSFRSTDQIVNITVTNVGNTVQKIKTVKVNEISMVVTDKMSKAIGSGKSLTFPVTLNYEITMDPVTVQVTTDDQITATAKLKYTVVENYDIYFDTLIIKDATVGQKGGIIPTKSNKILTLKATAEDGTKIDLWNDCELTFKGKGADDQLYRPISDLKGAGIYTIKIASKKNGYRLLSDEMGKVDYVVAAATPVKLKKTDLTIQQRKITVNDPVSTVEYQLLPKGTALTWDGSEKGDARSVEFTVEPGKKYVLYYRTAATIADDRVASKPLMLAVESSTAKKLTIKSNNTKYGTVTATVDGVAFRSGTAIEAGKEVVVTLTAKPDAYADGLFKGSEAVGVLQEDKTYKFTTTEEMTALTAKFIAKTAEETPDVYDITKGNVIDKTKDSFKINTDADYKYLVTTAKSGVKASTAGWFDGATGFYKFITISDLKPDTDYYVYLIKKGNSDATPPTKDSAVSKKSEPIRTNTSISRTMDTDRNTIYGIVGQETKGKVVYTITNTGSENFKITDVSVVDGATAFFNTDFKKEKEVKAGKTATITVTVDKEKAIATDGEFTWGAELQVTFDKQDDNDSLVMKKNLYYTASKCIGVNMNSTDLIEGKKIVTYNKGKELPYSTKKVTVHADDCGKVNVKNVKVSYKMEAPTDGEYVTTAPSEVGVYTVKLEYSDAVNSAYTGEMEFTYIIQAAKPETPLVSAKASCVVELKTVPGLKYEVSNIYECDDDNDIMEFHWRECENPLLFEGDGEPVVLFTKPGTKVTVNTYIPSVTGDDYRFTESITASKTITTPKSSKVTIVPNNNFEELGEYYESYYCNLKFGNYVLSRDDTMKLLCKLYLETEHKYEIRAEIAGKTFTLTDGTIGDATKECAGVIKVTHMIKAGNESGLLPTSAVGYTYVIEMK